MRFVKSRLDLFAELPPGTEGVEVGVQAGMLSAAILNFAPSIKKLHLVDCWEHQKGAYGADPANVSQAAQDTLFENVKTRFSFDDRVVIHRAYSIDAVDKFLPESLDWVYLDADHTYDGAITDLIFWGQAVKKGGCIMGHDFIDNGASRNMGFGVVKAVEKFLEHQPLNRWTFDALTVEEWSSYKLVKQ